MSAPYGPVPRSLHQIWFGGRPVPVWQHKWAEAYSTWNYRLWREDDVRRLIAPNRPLAAMLDAYLARRDYPGAADVARVEVLRWEGGVYCDIDATPLRPFDDGPFMADSFFVAYEPVDDDQHLPGRLANGTLGSVPHHPIWTTYLKIIGDMAGHGKLPSPAWDTVGGTALTAAVLTHRRCCRPTVLPAGTFYPRNRRGETTAGASRPYVDHLWASTNRSYPRSG